MVSVRHGDAIPMQAEQCQRCECDNGRLQCTDLDEDSRCPRSDPDQRPANCMTRGDEEVQHGEMRQVSCDAVKFQSQAYLSRD